MNCKKIIVLFLLVTLCLGLMPRVQAAEEFETITLQQIADELDDEEIKKIAGSIFEMEPKYIKEVVKTVTENTLTIATIDEGYSEVEDKVTDRRIETTLTLDGTILSSSKMLEFDGMAKEDQFHMYIAEQVFTTISQIMGYSKKVMYYEWENIDKYTLENEGMQIISGKEGQYNTRIYQIDLSKKVKLQDLRKPLDKAMDLYEEMYGKDTDPDNPEALFIKLRIDRTTLGDGIVITKEGKEIAKLSIDDNIITSEKLNASGEMSDEEKFQHTAVRGFLDCIGQAIYGYKEGALIKVLADDNIKNYKISEDGLEKVDLGNGSYQFKIDISKKVPLTKETQKPEEPKDNTIKVNSTDDNKVIDNTVSKDKLPQTGDEIMWILPIIGILLIVIISRVVILHKNKV